MNAGAKLTGEVESLLPGGEALVRADGHAYLIANAVPGDHIIFKQVERRRGALRGDLLSIVESSSERVSSPCPIASLCGGCSLQFLNPAKHSEVKSAWVFDAFSSCRHLHTIDLSSDPVAATARRRIRWYVGDDEKGTFLGFRAKASHTVVRHDGCMCAMSPLNQLREALEESGASVVLDSFESVQAIGLDDGIHLILEGGAFPSGLDIPFHQVNGLSLQWWHRCEGITRPLHKPVQSFHDHLPAGEVEDISLLVGPDDFIQGLKEGNRVMIKHILEWSRDSSFVVDLFSGIGNLSLPVAAAHGSRVVGAELNDASVRAANANAKRLNLDAKYIQTNLFENFNVEPFAGADLLILDPPRRGAKKVCSMMGSLLPAKIVMVNCDVASGGRDGEMLKSLGYRLHTLRALDLFPYTGHVEAMSLWVR
ncbi:MAG TPA: methyltransferase [Mariprofundaceae bacterium]|nr:methyltransferase [Mariprofundaceae bacterium]